MSSSPTQISPQYAAGFFDGEGCVSLVTGGRHFIKNVYLRLILTNTNIEILQLFSLQFGGKIRKLKSVDGWKQGYQLTLIGDDATNFVNLVDDFILIKRLQFEIAKKFINLKNLPKELRFDHTIGVNGNTIISRKPDIVVQEFELKQQLHTANHRGN